MPTVKSSAGLTGCLATLLINSQNLPLMQASLTNSSGLPSASLVIVISDMKRFISVVPI